jgi:hypothetical protein
LPLGLTNDSLNRVVTTATGVLVSPIDIQQENLARLELKNIQKLP